MNIVLIDDEESCHATIDLCLFGTDHKLVSFISPVDGVKYIAENYNNVDLILLDYMMPEMSGLEVIKLIKEIKAISKLPPIIIQTGIGKVEDVDECVAQGASKYIFKPFNRLDFLDAIDAVVC